MIDLIHMGRAHVIVAHVVDDVIVDPGPASCVETLLAGLGDVEPRALLLTHIHLDHAGATGTLVKRFPALKVYVHARGAPHMVDPSRLLASAGRLYGDDMDALWGEVLPVPEQNISVLEGGETVEGMRVFYTPGHASHHVCYFSDGGDLYSGDVAGVRIPGIDYVIAPTPPPEIDVELWGESIDLIAGLGASVVHVTHAGSFSDVEAHLDLLRGFLARSAERARPLDRDLFLRGLADEVETSMPLEDSAAIRQAAPPGQLYSGLERYWKKRVEAASGPDSR